VLKGKSEPVPAFRLLAAHAAPERLHASLFVGRERELGLLSEAWERAVAEQRCELVTVVGDPGIGKSRLAAEALASIEARVVRGRCLPYGAGITYWPVVEVIKQLGVMPADPAAATAIRSLLGESDAGTSAEEIGWAFRKLLEEQAPLVVVFDDIQWGEETFLDLIEHVALLSSGAPMLLLCMARPELLDSRPSWPVTIRLEPLDAADAESLIGPAVSEGLRARIAAAAAGNPFFISEMLTMTQEAQAGDDVEVPASLKALLAARLDQLDPAERRVLECGSVEGEVFHRGAVQALTPEEAQVTPRLAALVRRELIRSDRPQFAGEDGFRFRHLLIRDTAYDALPKTARAELHQRFAQWLDEHGRELVEREEIVGYHLEQAAQCLASLGQPDHGLAAEAAARLAAAGRRARWQLDRRTARSLLQRAVDLSDHPDVHVVVDLARVHAHRGNHADAERFAREAVAYSQQTDSPWTQGDALWDLATVLEAGGRLDDALAALREALGLYEQKEIVPVARRTRERLAALQAPTA
jgi:predicted ATPase